MKNIQQHIDYDKKILDNPLISSQSRRHVEEELQSLERYQQRHPENDRNPSSLELYCDENPNALECRIYEN
jgi:hypothetical protein